MKSLLLCFLLAIVSVAVLYFLLSNWTRRKRRSYDEFQVLLREFDWKEAKLLFDHEEEDRLKSLRDSIQFRRDQRARLETAIEYVSRAYHGNRLSSEWNNTEWRDMVDYHLEYQPSVVEAMRTLRRETALFRRIALLDLSRMWLWSLLHFDKLEFMPVPSIAAFRKVGGEDILQAYERVRQATANLARLAYSEEEAQLVLAKM